MSVTVYGASDDLIEVEGKDDEDNYTDRATVSGDVSWVVCGMSWAATS